MARVTAGRATVHVPAGNAYDGRSQEYDGGDGPVAQSPPGRIGMELHHIDTALCRLERSWIDLVERVAPIPTRTPPQRRPPSRPTTWRS